jgi:hypothetical protein
MSTSPPNFAYTHSFTPILDSDCFDQIFGGENGRTLPVDSQGLLRHVETVAFPFTKMQVLEQKNQYIVRIKTADYPYGENLFVDKRFLQPCAQESPERKPVLPSPSAILSTMDSLIGTRYFWGGNCLGIPEMMEFYPPQVGFGELDETTLRNWTFQGVDCSGLIYFATQGYTPRNTSSWVTYGQPVPLEGMKISQILEHLKPLDALVWPGHIIFVKDSGHIIESLGGHGVIVQDIRSRLTDIIEIKGYTLKNVWNKNQAEKHFVIRRWHPKIM